MLQRIFGNGVEIKLGHEGQHATWVNGSVRQKWQAAVLRLKIDGVAIIERRVNAPGLCINFDCSRYPVPDAEAAAMEKEAAFLISATRGQIEYIVSVLPDENLCYDMLFLARKAYNKTL